MKEMKGINKSKNQENVGTSRRGFIAGTLTAAAGSLALAASQNRASAQTGKRNDTKSAANSSVGRRRLGKLEVSSVGMGVQNMSRKYETTVPYRPEMINIIRAAYDRGVTFFDTAEAYGPFECERILGESIAPFRGRGDGPIAIRRGRERRAGRAPCRAHSIPGRRVDRQRRQGARRDDGRYPTRPSEEIS